MLVNKEKKESYSIIGQDESIKKESLETKVIESESNKLTVTKNNQVEKEEKIEKKIEKKEEKIEEKNESKDGDDIIKLDFNTGF
jgi:hypothetical protein